ncbi:hypothetical protein S40288_09503 [Stachybotrys chartarum IBT 40288]|nr:hypothetical protein S40288_09503 [Stachybotrys chartarum IBT 40288]
MGGTWVHCELSYYGLVQAFKPTITSINPAQSLHNFGAGLEDGPAKFLDTIEKIARDFFAVNSFTSRELLPWPNHPYRQSALWRKYDCLSAKQRLEQLSLSPKDKELFASYISLFRCCSLEDTSFFEILRWYALSGPSTAGVYEYTSTYKLSHGGMTSFARAILSEYTGDRLFNTPIVEVTQDGSSAHIATQGDRRSRQRWLSLLFRCKSDPLLRLFINCLSDVKFSPPLSALRSEAARHGHQNKGSKYHIKLGSQDPLWFATGEWSCWGPNAMIMYHTELQRPHDRVVFASADWPMGGEDSSSAHSKAIRTYSRYLAGQYGALVPGKCESSVGPVPTQPTDKHHARGANISAAEAGGTEDTTEACSQPPLLSVDQRSFFGTQLSVALRYLALPRSTI